MKGCLGLPINRVSSVYTADKRCQTGDRAICCPFLHIGDSVVTSPEAKWRRGTLKLQDWTMTDEYN